MLNFGVDLNVDDDILSKMWFKAQLETQLDDPCHSYLTIQLTEKYSAATYYSKPRRLFVNSVVLQS